MKMNLLYFTILFCFFLNSLYLKAVPNSGTLLNFENELNKFNKLPKIIPDESKMHNQDAMNRLLRIFFANVTPQSARECQDSIRISAALTISLLAIEHSPILIPPSSGTT